MLFLAYNARERERERGGGGGGGGGKRCEHFHSCSSLVFLMSHPSSKPQSHIIHYQILSTCFMKS